MGKNREERGLKLTLPNQNSAPLSVPIEKKSAPLSLPFGKIVQAYLYRPRKSCRPICSPLENDAGQPGPHLYLLNAVYTYFKHTTVYKC